RGRRLGRALALPQRRTADPLGRTVGRGRERHDQVEGSDRQGPLAPALNRPTGECRFACPKTCVCESLGETRQPPDGGFCPRLGGVLSPFPCSFRIKYHISIRELLNSGYSSVRISVIRTLTEPSPLGT